MRKKFIDILSGKSSTRQCELGEGENGLGRLKKPFHYFGNYPGIAHDFLLKHKYLYFEEEAYDLFATLEIFLFVGWSDYSQVTKEGDNWDKIEYIPEYDDFLETCYLLLHKGWVKEDSLDKFDVDNEYGYNIVKSREICIDKTFDRLMHQKKKITRYDSIFGKYLKIRNKEGKRLDKEDIYKISEEYLNLDRDKVEELFARIYKIAEARSKNYYFREDYKYLANL
ncbi:MAG: hypothetical protein DRP06_01390 [Candidatus Aenigmatarchaeota archaeon]|nr:MAG: hypothetical protein DRP06_01390 [Candidatus Aenigmarchaeota archaeon]